MKNKILYILTAIITMFVFSIQSYGGGYIGTIKNTTYNIEAPCTFTYDDEKNQGTLLVGREMPCVAEDFSIERNGNNLSFILDGTKYDLDITSNGIQGKYYNERNGQKGTCNFKIKITDKNRKTYAETVFMIEAEAALNSSKSTLQNLFYKFHPTGEARSLRCDRAKVTFDDKDNIVKIKYVFTLFWQGPLQSVETTFSTANDWVANRWSDCSLINTTGFTSEDATDAAAGIAVGIGSLILNYLAQ